MNDLIINSSDCDGVFHVHAISETEFHIDGAEELDLDVDDAKQLRAWLDRFINLQGE
jgi:hypothetical protein